MTTQFHRLFYIFHITKCNEVILSQFVTGCYYKVCQESESVTDCYGKVRYMLQSVTDFITKSVRYILQSVAVAK